MALNKEQFRDLIDRTLTDLVLYSESAVNLLLGTAAVESGFGTYLRQIDGPALGIFMMEPKTDRDIWSNFLHFRPTLRTLIYEITNKIGPCERALEGNLFYQICMARVHYLRIPKELPHPYDVPGLAKYWKRYWNTSLGKGTIIQFIETYNRYVAVV